MIAYPANSLFKVEKKRGTSIKKVPVDTEFPFDLRFRIIEKKSASFQGPGIYAVTFKGELIYIGSYLSEKPQIIHDRWVKHIQTFTNRGYRLGFNAQTKKDSIPKNLKCFFDRDSFRYCDTGTVTSIERLSFASKHFDEFKNYDDNQIIENFVFYYHKLDKSSEVKNLESCLIKKNSPICNSSMPKALGCDDSSLQEVEEKLLAVTGS